MVAPSRTRRTPSSTRAWKPAPAAAFFNSRAEARRASTRELKTAAAAGAFHTLIDDGVRRVLEGVTTLEEVGRVVDLTERLAN